MEFSTPVTISRIAILFGAAAALLITMGILASRFSTQLGWSIDWRGKGYGFPIQTLCFGLAACFCGFAFIYSLWVIPWSTRAATWHLALSLVCVAIFGIGFVAVHGSAHNVAPSAAPLPILTQAMLGSWILVQPLFLLLQAWFLIDAIRRCCLLSRL
jgi:hypothetical protein